MNEIQIKIRNQFNTIQRLYRIAFSPEMEDAWRDASDIQKAAIEKYFETFNYEGIKRTVNTIRKNNLHAMTVPNLKRLAKRLQMKGWYRMDKDELILEIEDVRRRIKASRRSTNPVERCEVQQEKVQTDSVPTG